MDALVLVEPAVEIPVVLDPGQRRDHLSPPILSAQVGINEAALEMAGRPDEEGRGYDYADYEDDRDDDDD